MSTGSMYEEIKTSNNSTIIQMNFSQEVSETNSIAIADENNNVVFAFKTDRKISTFAYSSSDLNNQNYSVYTGTDIDGTLDKNNIYTNISSIDLSKMQKQENSNTMRREPQDFKTTNNNVMPNTTEGVIVLIVLAIIVVIIISIFIFSLFKKG